MGNILQAAGEAHITCCGVTLPPLEPEEVQAEHQITVTVSDGDLLITIDHPMTKSHHISFLALVTTDRITFLKLYPEKDLLARFPMTRQGMLLGYCNIHGLFQKKQ